jgi:hypothetical protein
MNATILDAHCRPVVNFDVENADHRAWVHEFRKTGSWRNCPVLFHSPKELSVVGHTTQALLDFYLGNEFTKTRSKRLLNTKVKTDI